MENRIKSKLSIKGKNLNLNWKRKYETAMPAEK
jgi:hypothetical protein